MQEFSSTAPEDYTLQLPKHIYNNILSHQNQEESPSTLMSQVLASQPQNNATDEAK